MSDMVREKPRDTRAMGRILGCASVVDESAAADSEEGDDGPVVMNLIISSDLLCHSEIMDRYSTNGSFCLSFAGTAVGAEAPASVISVSGVGVVFCLGDVEEVLQVLTTQVLSLLRYSLINAPISARRA